MSLNIVQKRLAAGAFDILALLIWYIVSGIVQVFAFNLIQKAASLNLQEASFKEYNRAIILLINTILYFVCTEGSRYHRTFGKTMMNIVVHSCTHTPITWRRAFLRTLYKLSPLVILGGLVVLDYETVDILTSTININIVYYGVLASPLIVFSISVLLTGKALHDRLAGTCVIELEELDSLNSADMAEERITAPAPSTSTAYVLTTISENRSNG